MMTRHQRVCAITVLPYAFCDVKTNDFSAVFSTGRFRRVVFLFVCRLLKCAFCRRQSAGIGRPTVSSCNFLRILESNDDESSNQLIFLPFFPHDLPWEKSTDRCFSNRRNRPVEKSAEKSFVLMSQNAYGSTVTRNTRVIISMAALFSSPEVSA